MTSVKERAFEQAIKTLTALNCQFAVITPDGVRHGTLISYKAQCATSRQICGVAEIIRPPKSMMLLNCCDLRKEMTE